MIRLARTSMIGMIGMIGLVGLGCPSETTQAGESSTSSSGETDESESAGESTSTSETSESGTETGETETGETETGETETGETGEAECGNGIIEADEECDDGRFNGPGMYCSASCLDNVCGDGDPGPNEACDDGNDLDGDACTNDCVLATCGNGVLDPGEECEDGDMDAGDGCTNACLSATCGDGVVWLGYEECDDGNAANDDACSNACHSAVCGDGLVQPGEACDDGNEAANDGCSACQEQRVLAVACGGEHTCAVLQTGAVRCWGDGSTGALGYGNTAMIGDDEPANAGGDLDLDGTAVAVTAGWSHTCARLEGGTVRCWGSNLYGQLGLGHAQPIGDNETLAMIGDVQVGGVVEQVAAGGDRTCVLLQGGSVRCWGRSGAYGYSSTTNIGDDELPETAGDVQLGGVATQISLGTEHACALLDSGEVRCWGIGSAGRLGYGNSNNVGGAVNNSPANAGPVVLGGVALEVSAGGLHTCAIMQGGTLRCWGRGADGQLGYASTSSIGDNELPIVAGEVDVGGVVVDVVTGYRHTCALLDTGALRCWGLAADGQLGYGNIANIGNDETPASAGDVDIGGPVETMSLANWHGCAILSSGALRCWGADTSGKLGHGIDFGVIGDNEVPSAVGYVPVY